MNLLAAKRMRVSGASALSSPYTIGIPSISGMYGFVERLAYEIRNLGIDPSFESACFVIHGHKLRAKEENKRGVMVPYGKLWPGTVSGNHVKPASFIENPEIDLEVSVLVRFEEGVSQKTLRKVPKEAKRLISSGFLRFAGGDVTNADSVGVETFSAETGYEAAKRLGPGFVILERRDVLEEEFERTGDVFHALLASVSPQVKIGTDEEGRYEARYERRHDGWLFPIGVGFMRISPFAENVKGARSGTRHAFAEAVATVGEAKSLYRVENLEEATWRPAVRGDYYVYTTKRSENG